MSSSVDRKSLGLSPQRSAEASAADDGEQMTHGDGRQRPTEAVDVYDVSRGEPKTMNSISSAIHSPRKRNIYENIYFETLAF